jgi:hypothetical protein
VILHLFVPYIAPSTNSMYAGQHWSVRSKHKSNAKKAVLVATHRQWHQPFLEPVSISVTPKLGKGRRVYDVSNYSYTYKLIEDCLVSLGILMGDTPKHVAQVIYNSPERGSETGIMLEISNAEK